jgi:hypothetical protein
MSAFHDAGVDLIEEHEVSDLMKFISGTDKEDPVARDDFKRFYLEK